MSWLLRGAFDVATAPFRWGYQGLRWGVNGLSNLGFNYVVTPSANMARATQRGFQRNVWYNPANAIVQARADLILLRSEFTTSLNDGNRARIQLLCHNAAQSVAGMIGELNGHRDFYTITLPQENDLVALQRYLDGIDNHIQGHADEDEIRFGHGNSKADLLRCFVTGLEIADRWGQGHGPVTALKKRVIKPMYESCMRRPTPEMRECGRLVRVLSTLPNDADPHTGYEVAEQLIRTIDRVVHQRCAGGVGSYEIVELAPLLLLQANLEDALSNVVEDDQLVPNLRALPAVQSANRFLTYYAERGYRPRLTQSEADPLVDQTRGALVAFRRAPDQAQIPELRERIDRLLINYADRGEMALVPLREARGALVSLADLDAIEELDLATLEQLRFAEEQLAEMGNAELGWFRRQGTTVSVSFDPTYSPPRQLVAAFHNLRRVAVILENDAIDNNELIESSTAAAQELQHLLSWLREPEQSDLYTVYFRRRLEELAGHLEGIGDEADPRSFLRGAHHDLFGQVRERLEFWSRPGTFGRRALPSIDTHALHALSIVNRTGGILRKAFLLPEEGRVTTPATEFNDALTCLEQELQWNLLQVNPHHRARLQEQIQAFRQAILVPNWHGQIATRETALLRYQNLEQTLVQVLQETSNVFEDDRQVTPWRPYQTPFVPEFQELMHRLELLDGAITSSNAEQILDMTRGVWSLSKAMVEQDRGDAKTLAKRYHLTPEMIRTLRDLSRMLENAVVKHATGSCDPSSDNFYFRRLPPSADRGALVSYSSYDAVQQSLHFMRYWKENNGPIPLFGAAQEYVSKQVTRYLVGEPSKLVPQAPAHLLQRANRLFYDSLSSTEVRGLAIPIVADLKRDIRLNPQNRSKVAPILGPLEHFLKSPASKPIGTTEARKVLARIADLQQKRGQQLLLDHEENAPLSEGGLLGKGLDSVIHKATTSLGLEDDSMVSTALLKGARTLHSAAKKVVHGSGKKPTPPPKEPVREERRVRFKDEVDAEEERDRDTASFSLRGRTHHVPSSHDRSNPRGSSHSHGHSRNDRESHGSHHSSRPDRRDPRIHDEGRDRDHPCGLPGGSGILSKIGSVLEGSLQFFSKAKKKGWTKTAVDLGARKTADLLHGYIGRLDPRTDKDNIAALKEVEKAIRKAGAGKGPVLDTAMEAISKGLEYVGVIPSSDDEDISDSYFLDLETMCDDALKFNQRRTPLQRPVQELLNEEKEIFVKNNSDFIPMKLLYEYVCGVQTKDLDFYADMIQKARAAGPEKEKEVLKETFLEELKKSNTSWFLRTIVGWFFYPILSLTKHFLSKFSDRGIDWVRDFIAKNNKETSSVLANRIVDRTNGFMAKLQSAYRRIANKPNISGNINEELKKELSQPEVNGGLKQDELYQKAADKFFDEFVAPDLCNWGPSVWKRLTNYHFDEGSTSDTIVHYLLSAVACVAAPVAWILSWPATWVLSGSMFHRGLGKRFIVNGPLIHTLVNQSVGSIEQNGYTHALNSVIYEWLRDVLITLRREFGAESEADRRSGKPSVDLKDMSIIEKEKLRTLLKETFSVLKKHKCGSPEELRKLVNNDSVLGKIKGEVEDQIYNQATEGVLEVVGAAFHSLLKKDQLETLFYQLTSTINGIYKKNQPIPPEEFKAKEEGINKLLDAILMLVINNVVDDKLDPAKGREKEQKIANGFLRDMDKISRDLRRTLKKRYEDVRKRADHGRLPSTTEAQGSLNALLHQTQHSLHKLIDLRTRIETSPDLSGSKKQLLDHLKKMHQELTAIVNPLTALKNPHGRKVLAKKMRESIDRFGHDLASIHGLLKDPTMRDLDRADLEIAQLKNLLERFNHEPALSDPSFALDKEIQRLEKAYQQIRTGLVLEDELRGALSTSSGPLCTWYGMVGTAASSSQAAQAAYAKVRASLLKLTHLPSEQSKLQDLITALARAGSSREKTEIFKQLIKAREEMLRGSRVVYEKAQKDLDSIRRHCKIELAKCRFDGAIPPGDALNQIGRGIDHFERWAQQPRTIKLANAKNAGLLQRAKEAVLKAGKKPTKKAIVSYVRKEVDGLLAFIRDPTIWRYGLFHSNILEPFVEDNG